MGGHSTKPLAGPALDGHSHENQGVTEKLPQSTGH